MARWRAVFRGVAGDAGFIAEEAAPAETPIGLGAGGESVFGGVSAHVRRLGAQCDGVVVSPAVREVSVDQPCPRRRPQIFKGRGGAFAPMSLGVFGLRSVNGARIFLMIFVPLTLMYGSLLTNYDPADSSRLGGADPCPRLSL